MLAVAPKVVRLGDLGVDAVVVGCALLLVGAVMQVAPRSPAEKVKPCVEVKPRWLGARPLGAAAKADSPKYCPGHSVATGGGRLASSDADKSDKGGGCAPLDDVAPGLMCIDRERWRWC